MGLDGIGDLIGIASPWELKKIKIQHRNMVIDVYLDFERGSKFHCQSCKTLCIILDSSVKRIRNLDIFDYRCYLNIKVPRLNCPRCGVKVSHADPWSRKGSHIVG